MKVILSSLFVLFIGLFVSSQESESTICPNPDIEAKYYGGQDSIFKYIERNLVYPKVALKEQEEGTVTILFVVEKSGQTSSIEILNSVSPSIDAEAKRLIANMPSWKPAIVGEETCRSKVRISLIFNLDFEKARRKKARKARRRRKRL